ncbi:hypothetical protein GMOD_00001646 [Pyrenophora seminiperda CCB06]|uniref:Uncharacterized protein n=1 Tax=Pyrenophora seminiperda CCB06 TaxID=1302712 RepID=A0A3M7LZQ9_9PLEO|nr:hypothetical protein GMOD_00001646 [Pyrenophora seminiperda CCB06]
MDSTASMRVIIRVRVTDIPGEPLRRHTTLGEMFCDKILHRPLIAQPNPTCYDGMHIPDEFYSELPVKRWFIYDINVQGHLDREQLLDIPHKVFLASKGGGEELTFIPRDIWIEKAKSYCKSWFWGGRQEQERNGPDN